jgi:hypothetical protein
MSRKMPAVAGGEELPKYCLSRGADGGFEWTTKTIGEWIGIKYRSEMRKLILDSKETTYTAPVLPDKATRQQELAWSKDYDRYLKQSDRYQEDKAKVYAIILSQCEEPLKNRVEGHVDYATFNDLALLKVLKDVTYGSNEKKYPPRQASRALRQLMMVHQEPGESLIDYYT